MIKLLCFDLDDTLYNNQSVIVRAEAAMEAELERLFRRYQRTYTRQDYLLAQQSVMAADPIACENMTEKRRRVLSHLLRFIESEPERTQVITRMIEDFIQQRSQVIIEARVQALLENLNQHYQLVAITNGNIDFDSLPVRKLFASWYSPTMGYRAKPHPDMLLRAMATFQLRPQEVVLIGDSAQTDGEAAKNAGVKFIPFAPFAAGKLDTAIVNRLEEGFVKAR